MATHSGSNQFSQKFLQDNLKLENLALPIYLCQKSGENMVTLSNNSNQFRPENFAVHIFENNHTSITYHGT